MARQEKPDSGSDKESRGFLKWGAIAVALLTLIGGAFQVGIKVGQDTSSSLLKSYEREIESLRRSAANCQNSPNPRGNSRLGDLDIRSQIKAGETATAVTGHLFITALQIPSNPSAPHSKISLILGGPGRDNMPWEAELGDFKIFNGFEIRVTAVNGDSVELHVSRAVPLTS